MEPSRKREREKASQRRRMQVKSSNTSTSASHPLFAEPIERRDSSSDDLQIIAKNVLGDYGRFHSMGINERSKLLGVVDTTPSTPILPKHQNPFESEFRKTSSGGSSTSSFATATTTASTPVSASSTRGGGGGEKGFSSGLRHPVAEPPPSTPSTASVEKKREREKNRQHSKHSLKGDYAKAGSASRPHGTPTVAGSNAAKRERGVGVESSSKPTNIMVVPKKKGTVRPPLRVPVPTSPMSSGAGGVTTLLSSAPSKSKQPSHSLGELFQVDMTPQQQERGGSSGGHSSTSSSGNKPLKQRKSRTKAQHHQSQVIPSSSSSTSTVSFTTSIPSSSLYVPPKSSSNTESTVPVTSAPLSSYESVPKPKRSVLVSPNVCNVTSVSGKDSIDTKVIFPLVRSSSSGGIEVAPQPLGFQARDEAEGYPTSIDIAHIHNLSFKDNSAAIQPNAVVEALSRKKEKKRKKKHREKEKMDTSESLLPDFTSTNVGSRDSSEAGAFGHVTPISGHMTFTDSHVIPSDGHMTTTHASTSGEVPTSLKVHLPKPRPSALKITGSSMESEEASADTGDIHISMLEELMRPLPSLITPISTPKKPKPFSFQPQPPSLLSGSSFKKPSLAETSRTASTKLKPRLNSRRSYLGSTSSEESDIDGGRKEAINTAMSTLNRALESESHSLHPTEMESSSGSSSSIDSSSDSSGSSSSPSSDEDEGDEQEKQDQESISPVSKLLLPLVTTITPLKKTPPHFSNVVISPLADETANMSPPKPTASTLPQYTYEWPPTSTAAESTLQNQDVSDSESESSSSSDSDDSGSESDSESSDSEDLSSAAEDTIKGTAIAPTSSVEGSRLGEMHLEQVSDTSQSTRESFGFNPIPHPFGSSWSTAQEQNAPPDENGRLRSSHEQQNELSQSQPSRKRRHEPELQPVARKAPKVTTTKTSALMTAKEERTQRELQYHSQLKRKSSRRDSFLSSFSLSESDNSDDSSSEKEDGETFMDTSALPELNTKSTTATTTRSHEATLLSPLQQHHHHQQQTRNRSDAGGVAGLGQQEPLLHAPGALVVRIPLPLLLRDQQKPKATVEPYIVNAPNKPPGRRLTSETADHEGTHTSRCMGHPDRERDVYPRHREGLDHHRTHVQLYGDDYRRSHDSDRPRSRNGRNWDSSHDHRNLSGSDQDFPPQSRRRGGRGIRGEGREYRGPSWERERDYHGGGGGGGSSGRGTDDYWGDYGHYERRMEYSEGRRQRGYRQERGYGAQHYLQEARRRKHDADKIRDRGVEKAKAYMESVAYFIRHGDAAERESQQQQWDSSHKNPFRMYSDTIQMIKHSQAMSGDCKPLLVICSRCQAVLYWRLYLLKQMAASQIQKELQEFFVTPKGAQKSPYPNSFSPLPSPASVSSTGSGCSGGGASQDPSPSATVSVPKHIFNKATEHLTISTYLTQSFELWKHSEILMEQCRDFFANVHRNVRISQQSAIPNVADWMEQSLRNLRWV